MANRELALSWGLVAIIACACNNGGARPASSIGAPTGSTTIADADVQDAVTAMDASADADAIVDAGVWPAPHADLLVKLTADTCFGNCPVFTVTLHGDGSFVVAVVSPRKGCVSGTASPNKVGKIEALARSADFTHLKTLYETQQHDRRWITTTITLDSVTGEKQTRTIRRWGSDEKDPTYAKLIAIENAIDDATSASTLADTGTLSPCASAK